MFEPLKRLIESLQGKSVSESPQLAGLDNMQINTGIIVDLTAQALAAGVDGKSIQQRNARLYEKGLTSYGVEFSEPVQLPTGFKTTIAMIPVDFKDATLRELAKANIGKTASVAMTTVPETRTSEIIFMSLD